MKTRISTQVRWLFWVGAIAFWTGIGGAGYRVILQSTLANEGLLWFVLGLTLGATIWGTILGFFQSTSLYCWRNNDRVLMSKWLRASVIGWGLVGGILGGILVVVAHFIYAIMWGGFDALFFDPPTWISLLSGIVGSSWLQTRVMRREFENPNQWWRGNLLGWGGGLLLFLGLNRWLSFTAYLTGALSGLAAGIVAGVITGTTLIRMLTIQDNSGRD